MTSAVDTIIQAVSPLSTLGLAASALAGSAAGLAASAAAAGRSGVAAGLSCASAAPVNTTQTTMASHAISFFIAFSLKGGHIGFAGADADDLLQVENENLAVADLAGIGRALDGLDGLLEQLGLHRGLDLHLGQEIDHVLRAAVELGVAFLAAEALDLGDGDSLHPDRGERFAHLVELERLDDGGNEFHGAPLAQKVLLTDSTTVESPSSMLLPAPLTMVPSASLSTNAAPSTQPRMSLVMPSL